MNYVVGFLFDDTGKNIVLIKKNKPEWQCGLLNGICGKVEFGENPSIAMIREGEEEMGVICEWNWFGTTEGEKDRVDFYRCFSSFDYGKAETREDEHIIKMFVPSLILDQNMYPSYPDFQFIIPIALRQDIDNFYIKMV